MYDLRNGIVKLLCKKGDKDIMDWCKFQEAVKPFIMAVSSAHQPFPLFLAKLFCFHSFIPNNTKLWHTLSHFLHLFHTFSRSIYLTSFLITTMEPNTNNEVVREFPRLFRAYKDGRIDRFLGTETTPPGTDPTTAVQSKDVTINPQTTVAARLYLPPTASSSSSQKLPILVYIHGGAFCVCTPFNPAYHSHLNAVCAAANVLVASVHYRLAPEHPLPAAYHDAWEAFLWVASHAAGAGPEPWLNAHADPGTVFLAGDSAGGNIAHTVAMRGSAEGFGGLTLQGMVLLHPFFGNDKRDELVEFLYPTYKGSSDMMIHAPLDPKLSDLACPRLLIFLSEKDFLRDRALSYYEALKKSGWKGVVEKVEFPGENHVFHLVQPSKQNSLDLVNQFVAFLKQIPSRFWFIG